MKKSLSAALIAAALCSPWVAQAQETYVKFGVGQGHYSMNGASADKTGASLAFGQTLAENWGYEIGYANFGKWSGSETSGSQTTSASVHTQSLYAALVGTLPLHESFSLFGKVGAAVNYTKGKISLSDSATPSNNFSRSDSETKVKPMIGVGAAYHFNKQLAATAEYQYFGKVVDELKVSGWTLGLKYGF